MEIVTSWMEDGIEEGLQQGLQQGEQRVVTRQLTRRFGVLPDDFQARIGVLSIAQLDQLGEALLDFGTIADLTSWLDRYARTEDTR